MGHGAQADHSRGLARYSQPAIIGHTKHLGGRFFVGVGKQPRVSHSVEHRRLAAEDQR